MTCEHLKKFGRDLFYVSFWNFWVEGLRKTTNQCICC